jgi:hypothetical protein
MAGRCTFTASRRLRLVVLLTLVILPGCGESSPVAPGRVPPTISGYVYLSFTPDTGEPPLADVVITVRDSNGAETTTVSGRSGYYSVRAAMGTVVVTASKPGYETRQSRFDVAESTVLNFSMKPTTE